MSEGSLGRLKSFETGGDFRHSGFSNERAWTREPSSLGQQKEIKPKDPQFDPFAGIPRYTAPALLAAGSIALGVLSISRSRSLFTRVVAGAGSLATGTLALGAAFAEVKGDN